MKRQHFTSLLINKHLHIVRYLLVIAAIITIASFFPKNNFSYDFELDRPWKYENLLAPFQFTIKKSGEQIKQEEEAAINSILPAYRQYDTVATAVKKRFIQNFNQAYAQLAPDTIDSIHLVPPLDSLKHIKLGLQLIDTIYQKGIIQLEKEAVDKVRGREKVTINLSSQENSQILKIQDVANLFTIYNQQPCRFIIHELPKQAKQDPTIKVNFLNRLLCNMKEKGIFASNIIYDAETTKKLQESKLEDIIYTNGLVLQGEVIVAQGAIIREAEYQKLQSLKDAYVQQKKKGEAGSLIEEHFTDIGHLLLTFIIFFIFVAFIQTFDTRSFEQTRDWVFILMLIVSFLYLIKVAVNIQQTNVPTLSLHVIPFCIIPIIIKAFFGNLTAHYVHIVVILLTGFLVPLGYEYLFLHFIAGLVAIIANIRTYYWSHFFISTAYIFGTYCIGYLGIALIQNNSFDTIKWATFGWLGINTFFTLLAYPLIPVVEKLFGFVSNLTLVELSDVNRPLLKELFKKAPGTFQHSMQVANLAESAAAEIGANPLLTKVGALYHDVGKMYRPIFFVENQKTDFNPHNDLSPEESAYIIINHVIYGIELAKKHDLPNIIVDFIRTHHGTTRTEYFYRQYIKDNPRKEVDERLFRYPGPMPYSKETALVMMADSIEAASKSLKRPSEEEISALVDNIIDGKIKQNQFVNCDLSFKDITKVKKVLKKQLKSIYHIRISYPETKSKERPLR